MLFRGVHVFDFCFVQIIHLRLWTAVPVARILSIKKMSEPWQILFSYLVK